MTRSKRRTPGPRPGARKPGAKPRGTDVEKMRDQRAEIQARIAREVAKYDFARRAVDLRRLNKTYVEIAQIMSQERGETVHHGRVRAAVLKELRNVDALADVRYAELDKVESMAARLREKLDEMDQLPVVLIDMEVYAKIADTYLKYRERVAKLVGLDAAIKQKIERDPGDVPGQPLGGSVHIGVDGITVHMPGSISAYEDWAQLTEKGLTDLARDVIELEEGDHEEIPGLHDYADGQAKAGVTLAPHADVTPGAERKMPSSALEALDALRQAEQ